MGFVIEEEEQDENKEEEILPLKKQPRRVEIVPQMIEPCSTTFIGRDKEGQLIKILQTKLMEEFKFVPFRHELTLQERKHLGEMLLFA